MNLYKGFTKGMIITQEYFHNFIHLLCISF